MLIQTALSGSLLMLVQSAAPATAPEAPPAEPSASAAEQQVADDDKVICRRTAVVGSRFKKRICGTRREWATLRARGKDTTRDMQRAGRGLDPNGG